jgi:hypothetical protein
MYQINGPIQHARFLSWPTSYRVNRKEEKEAPRKDQQEKSQPELLLQETSEADAPVTPIQGEQHHMDVFA